MDFEIVSQILDTLAWPLVALFIVLVLRHSIAHTFTRIRGIEVPGGVRIDLEKMDERMKNVEEVTKEIHQSIYNLTGDSQRVRDEVWEYIAKVLKRISPEAALEVRIEMNKYHSEKMENVEVSKVKEMLNTLGFYFPTTEEEKSFSNKITAQYVQAALDFQEHANMIWSDGIVGPYTTEKLLAYVEKHKEAKTNP